MAAGHLDRWPSRKLTGNLEKVRVMRVFWTRLLLTLCVLGVGPAIAGGHVASEQDMATEYRLAVNSLISGDKARAESHYRNALHYAELADIHDERVASSCFELAMILADVLDFAEAYQMMERAYRTRLELLGDDHPDVRDTASALSALAAMVNTSPDPAGLSRSGEEAHPPYVGGVQIGFSGATQ
jgi:hypothetical protein